jgi:hypothetical protein
LTSALAGGEVSFTPWKEHKRILNSRGFCMMWPYIIIYMDEMRKTITNLSHNGRRNKQDSSPYPKIRAAVA